MRKQHNYLVNIQWTGNTGTGTSHYKEYQRNYLIKATGKPDIWGSSDPAFRGDRTRYNPEELLVASLSSCHMLWYLHLCAEAGIIVVDYQDEAAGTMIETIDGGGRFTNVTLHPVVAVADSSMVQTANQLHQRANQLCFIANSCNFPIHHEPTCYVSDL